MHDIKCVWTHQKVSINDMVDCESLDDSDYEVQCLCYNGSGCNQDNEAKVEALIKAPINDAVLAEVNKSIRQLRADLKRTIQRYSRQMNVDELTEELEGWSFFLHTVSQV